MPRGNFYPRSQNYADGHRQMRERQVKYVKWSDIDDYIATYHDWEIGDTLVALKGFDMSWGWEMEPGDTCLLNNNTILLLLDFQGITEYLTRVED